MRDAEGDAGTERLHKFLASSGAGSRRECETFIEQGRVSVNGAVVRKMGVKVRPGVDDVRLDGEKVKIADKVYYLLHKPNGYICTNSDERGRPRVIDLVRDPTHRIYTVGRLDADSRGLILLTNDGEIANIVCHPRYRIEKVYQVVVRGSVDRRLLTRLESGVWLAEGKASPARVMPVGYSPKRDETLLEVTLFEGRNREIRRVFAKVGLKVVRLIRTKLGPLELGDLAVGTVVRLRAEQLAFVHEAERMFAANREAWEVDGPPPEAPQRKGRRPMRKGKPRAGAGLGAGAGRGAAGGGFGARGPARGGFRSPREDGPGAPRGGGWSGPRRGGFGAPREGGGGFGAPRQGGFGAPREGGREGGFGAPRDAGSGAPRRGGFGAPREGGWANRPPPRPDEGERRERD